MQKLQPFRSFLYLQYSYFITTKTDKKQINVNNLDHITTIPFTRLLLQEKEQNSPVEFN